MTLTHIFRLLFPRRHRVATDAPDWDDVRGKAPDATGAMSSEDFVRQLRDDWDEQP